MADFKITRSDELMHYRTKGSKNGVRLYQNPDGSLTPLGERHYRDLYGYGAGVQRDGASDKYKSAPRNPNKYYESVSRAVEDRSYRLGKKRTDMDFNPYYQRHVNQKLYGQPYGKSYKTQLPTDKLKNPENFTRDERWEVAQNIIPQYNINKEYREQLAALREKARRSKLTDYERAKEDATKWVVDRADDVKKGATDAYNSASKWVVDRADDVKKGATDAYNRASDAAVKVGDAAKNAYNDASKWVVDRADDVKKGATDASKWALDRVNDAELAANKAYNNASKWVVDRADDVKKTAGEALDAGKKWVEQAGKDVGKFADSALSDVTKAVDDAKKGVTDAANSVGKAAQDGWNWVKGLFGGGNDQDKEKKK